MSGLRAWILLLVGTVFLVGFASGLLTARRLAPPPAPSGAFVDYRQLLVQEFDLSPERERGLAGILERYRRELDDLSSRHAENLEPELARLGTKYHGLVRDHVLPESQRPRFDELVAVHWQSSGGSAAPGR